MADHDAATPGERLHALDLVRATALLLGIVFHAALPFIPEYELWLVMDVSRSWPVAWLAFGLHTFRMATFFLLAGYFGHMMLERRGAKAFAENRAKRVLAPLLIFWLPVLILFGVALALAAFLGVVPTPDKPPPAPALSVDRWPLTHLWFLYVLAIFYAAILVVRTGLVAIDRDGAVGRATDRVLGILLRLPFVVPLLLAVPVALLFLNHEGWREWWGVPTPDTGLLPNGVALGSFGLAFGFGWLAHRQKEGLAPLAGQWALYLPVALALTIACIAMTDGADFAPQLEARDKPLYAALYAASVWLWAFGLIGAALRFIRRESPRVRYLADSSYWLYIIHLPLIVGLEAVVARWPAPAELKLLLVVTVGVGLMLASYHFMVRSTFLGELLNGHRYPRKREPAEISEGWKVPSGASDGT